MRFGRDPALILDRSLVDDFLRYAESEALKRLLGSNS